MKYCFECGTELHDKPLDGEGMVPYCETCQTYRFPIFNTAVSMEVLNPAQDKVILIQQYGRSRNILVAGYVNRGESVEHTVVREVEEELGLHVSNVRFNMSQFFEPSNTLMVNFSCVADTEDLSRKTDEVDYAHWYTFDEAREAVFPGSLAEKFLVNFITHRGEAK